MQLESALSFETLYESILYMLDGQESRFFRGDDTFSFSIVREEDLVCLAQVRELHGYPVFDPLVIIALENGQAIPLRCVSEKHGQQDSRSMKGDWKAREELLVFVGLWLKTLSDKGVLTLQMPIQ